MMTCPYISDSDTDKGYIVAMRKEWRNQESCCSDSSEDYDLFYRAKRRHLKRKERDAARKAASTRHAENELQKDGRDAENERRRE